MNIVSYLSRYLLAAIFAVELGYKLVDWGGWIGQFTSILPFGLPWNLASIAAIGFAVVEGLLVISLVLGKEKFITGWVAIALLLGIMVSLQRVTIGAGAYQGVAAVVRGFLQDQHMWMMLAAGYVVVEGWKEMQKRHLR
ncbi:MAG: hypothetical protein AAB579_01050 [Patescibacteria group bacterium]